MTKKYTIHKTHGKSLTLKQIKRLIELVRQLDDAEQGYCDDSGLKLTRPTDISLKKWLRDRDLIVHADDKDGNILGFSSTGYAEEYENAGYVGSLVVDKRLQGYGIGGAILDAIIHDNRRKRIKTVLNVFLNNRAGLALYMTRGFKVICQTMVLGDNKG